MGNFAQWGNPDAATPRADEVIRDVNRFQRGRTMTVLAEEAPANYVPAAAVIRRGRALSGITGRKARAGGLSSGGVEAGAQPPEAPRTGSLGCGRGRRNSGVAVKCADIGKNTDGEGSLLGRHRR